LSPKDYIFIAALNGVLVSTGHLLFSGNKETVPPPEPVVEQEQKPKQMRVFTPPKSPEEPDVKSTPVSEEKKQPLTIYDPNFNFHRSHEGPLVLLSKGDSKVVYRLGEHTQYGKILAIAPDGVLCKTFKGEVIVTPVEWGRDD